MQKNVNIKNIFPVIKPKIYDKQDQLNQLSKSKTLLMWESQEEEEVIYSLEERKIGRWIDNKPLYEKTIVTEEVGRGVENQPFNHNIKNVDFIFSSDIISVSGDDIYKDYEPTNGFVTAVANAESVLLSNNHSGSCYFVITLRYTKTTDEPIS